MDEVTGRVDAVGEADEEAAGAEVGEGRAGEVEGLGSADNSCSSYAP